MAWYRKRVETGAHAFWRRMPQEHPHLGPSRRRFLWKPRVRGRYEQLSKWREMIAGSWGAAAHSFCAQKVICSAYFLHVRITDRIFCPSGEDMIFSGVVWGRNPTLVARQKHAHNIITTSQKDNLVRCRNVEMSICGSRDGLPNLECYKSRGLPEYVS